MKNPYSNTLKDAKRAGWGPGTVLLGLLLNTVGVLVVAPIAFIHEKIEDFLSKHVG